MLDDFWNIYINNIFLTHYYELILEKNRKIVLFVNAATTVTTTIGLANILGGRALYFWSATIFIMQIVANLKDVWEVSKKTWSLKLYLQDMNKLLLEMGQDWRLIEQAQLYEDEVLNKISYYEKQFLDIKERYLGSFSFSENAKYIAKANKKADAALVYKHPRKEIQNEQSC